MRRFIILIVITIITAFLLSFLHVKWSNDSYLNRAKKPIFATLSLFNDYITKIKNTSKEKITYLYKLNKVYKENELLKDNNNKLSLSLLQFKKAKKENIELRKELHYKKKALYKFKIISAEVIYRSADSWFSSITIDKGWHDGVETNFPVINTTGLVGRTVESSRNYSKVMLIINPQSNVSAEVIETKDKGILQGRSDFKLYLKHIPHSAVIKKDMTVYTSGFSNTFPKGILIGKINKIKKEKYDHLQHIEVIPSVKFSKLDKLWVIIPKKK